MSDSETDTTEDDTARDADTPDEGTTDDVDTTETADSTDDSDSDGDTGSEQGSTTGKISDFAAKQAEAAGGDEPYDPRDVVPAYGEDDQDYVDRSVVDFDPSDGLYSGTAVDGSTDIPGAHPDLEELGIDYSTDELDGAGDSDEDSSDGGDKHDSDSTDDGSGSGDVQPRAESAKSSESAEDTASDSGGSEDTKERRPMPGPRDAG